MSKFDEKIEMYLEDFKSLGVKSVDKDLLTKVTKACGPSIYLPDASKVSTSDKAECDRVKEKFLIGKLGLSASDDLDGGISAAVETFGASNKSKHRAMMYYMLTKHFKKESIYG